MTKICLNYPKLMQISLNLAEIEAHPKCIRNKSSEILNFFSAEIPSLVDSQKNEDNFNNEDTQLKTRKVSTEYADMKISKLELEVKSNKYKY